VVAVATKKKSPHALHAVAMQTTVVMVSRFVTLATLRFGFIFAFLYGAVNSDG